MAAIMSAQALSTNKFHFTPGALPELLSRPLILGASMSANRSAPSPGKTLALRLNKNSQIRTIAFGGKSARYTLPQVSSADLKDRSIIIGADLFFWDSTLSRPEVSARLIENFVNQAKELQLPIVLGEVPEILAAFQPAAVHLNRTLKRACDHYDKCYLMPFVDLHTHILKDGFLKIKGHKESLANLLPDGLHLSSKASEYLADLMQDVLLGRPVTINH